MAEKTTAKNYHFGSAALTLGIISVVTCLFYYLALPTGILALILGGKGAATSKLAKAGLILGIIGLSLTVFIYIFMIGGTILDYYN
jgi:hypothetical protein